MIHALPKIKHKQNLCKLFDINDGHYEQRVDHASRKVWSE